MTGPDVGGSGWTEPTSRLITIPLSHYCERARWALDHARVPYTEEGHLQIFHRAAVRRAGGRRTVPVLVLPDRSLTESRHIVRWAHERAPSTRRLYPDDPDRRAEVEALEDEFDAPFGVHTRKLAYWWLLPHRRTLMRYNNRGAPAWQGVALRAGFPLARGLLVRYFRLDDRSVAEAERAVLATMDRVAERLEDGRPFLFGDRLTAADMTFAALVGPVIWPRSYGLAGLRVEDLPGSVRSKVERFRAHPAGAFALRLYDEHR